MLVLWAGLAREQDEFLGAAAVGVDVDQQLQPGLGQPAQTEVGDLDLGPLGGGERDACRIEDGGRTLAAGRDQFLCHVCPFWSTGP